MVFRLRTAVSRVANTAKMQHPHDEHSFVQDVGHLAGELWHGTWAALHATAEILDSIGEIAEAGTATGAARYR